MGGQTGENETGGEPKRRTSDENHRDQLNGPHQILMLQAAPVSQPIPPSHLPAKLITRLRQNF